MRHASTTFLHPSHTILGFICSVVVACGGADESTTGSDADLSSPDPIAGGAALDAHVHIMSQPLIDLVTGGGTTAEGAADVVERLDDARVQKAVMLSYGYLSEFPSAELARAENDYTAAQVALEPERLVGFCGINPLREGALDEFNRETLFVDTSSCLKFYADAPLTQKELIVWRLRKWGIANVLFGSDYDLVDPVETPVDALETLRSYPFTAEELETVLNNDGRAWLRPQ